MLTRSDIWGLVHAAKHQETILYPLGQPMQKNLLEIVRLMAQKIEEETDQTLEDFIMPRAPLVADPDPALLTSAYWDRVYGDSVKLNNDMSVSGAIDEAREVDEIRRVLK